MISISYMGVDSSGTPQAGPTEVVSLIAFVRRRYRAGWESLRVYRADKPDSAVGAIFTNPDTGHRVMWVES